MPITSQLDTGIPGKVAPLEGADESYTSGMGAVAQNAFASSLGVTGIEKVMQATAGGPHVDYQTAKATMGAQGYDTSGIPQDGLPQGALDIMMQRQQELEVTRSVASRANLGTYSRFVASMVGGAPDPVNVAVMAFAPEMRGGTLLRAAQGGAMGAAYTGATTYGTQAIGHTLGDPDQSSMDNLRQVLFGTAIGGGLHVGLGGKPPVVANAGRDMRADIFTSVAKAEDATGTGVITKDTGGITKFGISQTAHPDVDVANLTQSDATKILKDQYWDKIGGDKLPPEIQHTAMDAAVNQGPENAIKWLKESGGDPEKFNQLRADQYNMLAKSDPKKYGQYLNGWMKRLENVANEPILAQGEVPRVQSTDTMGKNVDELPPDVRDEAGQMAVTQFLQDDHVNVEQVINKGLEEKWGAAPNTDENPLEGTDPRDFTTNPAAIADDHARDVSSLEAQAYENVGRRLQGADTDMTKAIPQPGRAMTTQADLDRIQGVRAAAAEGQAKAPAEAATTEGPLTAQAKSDTNDLVKEAKAFFPNIGAEVPAEFENLMSDHDEAIGAHKEFAESLETAVRCAAQLGVE